MQEGCFRMPLLVRFVSLAALQTALYCYFSFFSYPKQFPCSWCNPTQWEKIFCPALCIGISSEMLHLADEKGQKKKSHSLLLWRTVFHQLTALLGSDTASRGKTNEHRGSIILQPSHRESAGHSIIPWLYSSFLSSLPQLVQVQVCICDSI